MLNSLQNGSCSLVFITLLLHTTTSKISAKNLFLYVSQFSLPNPLLLLHKIIHTNRINTAFFHTSAISHIPIFVQNHPSNLHDKYFPYLSHLSNSGCVIGTRKPQSRTVIIGLTITEPLLLRLRRLVYCR